MRFLKIYLKVCIEKLSKFQENGADEHLYYPQAVRNGQVGLLEIVRALGDYLTSTEDEVRVKG
jgi:hypothetical protein